MQRKLADSFKKGSIRVMDILKGKEGERKEERGWGRERGDLLVQMPRAGISGLGKGLPGPRGPPRLQKLLCHPGSPCSLPWVWRPWQSWAGGLFGEQAAQSPASGLRPP